MSSILLLTLAGPAILLVAALTLTVSKGAARSSRTSMLAVGATYAALLSQLPGVVAVLSRGAKTSTFGEGGAEAPWVAVRSDAVTTTMVLVVSALGIVVVKHALGQLAGDPRRDAFVARILETLSRETQPELSDIRIVRSAAEWNHRRPAYVARSGIGSRAARYCGNCDDSMG